MTTEELIAAMEKDSGLSILDLSNGEITSYGDLAELVASERAANEDYDLTIYPKLQKLLDERWS